MQRPVTVGAGVAVQHLGGLDGAVGREVATGKDQAVFDAAATLAVDLTAQGLNVLYDDRVKVSPGVKFKDAELIGVPTIVVVGKGFVDGVVEVKDRASGEREDVALADVVGHVVNAVREPVGNPISEG